MLKSPILFQVSDFKAFDQRKQQHIGFALDPCMQASGWSGLDQIHLFHDALPELDFSDISLETNVFHKKMRAPFFIAGMTAGHAGALEWNQAFSKACYEKGWALGVGSLRKSLLGKDDAELEFWKKQKKKFPGLMVFGNCGVSQLQELSFDVLERVFQSAPFDAFAIHLNALQEALQPEGTPYFKGAIDQLRFICKNASIPIIIKETGCGFSQKTLLKIKGLAFSALDVSGLGGTHWGRIEGVRSEQHSVPYKAAQTFATWGESTVESLLAARALFKKTKKKVWASGGVRSGLDAAKLFALVAQLVGYAQPALKALKEKALDAWMEQIEFECKVALFCTGSQKPEILSQSHLWKKKKNSPLES